MVKCKYKKKKNTKKKKKKEKKVTFVVGIITIIDKKQKI